MNENVFNAETQRDKDAEPHENVPSSSPPLRASVLEASEANDTFGDILLFALVTGIDLAMGQPRMRHPNKIIDMQIEAVIERWHTENVETQDVASLPQDEIPGWLLSLPNQTEVHHGDE